MSSYMGNILLFVNFGVNLMGEYSSACKLAGKLDGAISFSLWIFQTIWGGIFFSLYEPNGEYGIVPWRLERSLPCSRCGGHRSPPGCSLTGTTPPRKEEVRVRFWFWTCSLTLFPYWPRHHPSPDFSRIITWPSKKLQCSLSIIWIDKKNTTQHVFQNLTNNTKH